MKTLSGMFILVFALFFVGCATQEGGNSASSLQSISSSSSSGDYSGGGSEGDSGPDASDGDIAGGSH